MKRFLIFIGIVLIGQLGWGISVKDDLIKVTGVVNDINGNPLNGVTIMIEGEEMRASTGLKGQFELMAPKYGKLLFSCVGYETVEERVLGRSLLTVQMESSNTLLPEVTVTSMMDKSVRFNFEPSELEVVKDQLLLKTRYKVPKGRFHKDSRMVVHPYLVNYTKNVRKEFNPMVFDGVNYDILVKRGHVCGDSTERAKYTPYAKVVEGIDPNSMISYSDSCEIEEVNDKYATEVYVTISTFCRDEYRDTIVIARGVVYPMRFFDFETNSFELDNSYAPKQNMLKFEEKGQLHLRFRTDEYKIYQSDGRNWTELNKMRKALLEIGNDTTKTLTSFSIMGYASPEGSLKYNEKLAKNRVKSAIDAILEKVPVEMLKNADVTYDGIVYDWNDVFESMMNDSLLNEANELERLIKRARGSHDEISWGVRRLKCYPLIRDKYLPKLRYVEYTYQYNLMRSLTIEEIDKIYRKDPSGLTASEFWRYISERDTLDLKEKETLMRKALEVYPDLMIAANNLAVLLNEQHRPDTTLLLPFLKEDAPVEITVNQVVALLQTRDFDRANQLAESLPLNDKTRIVKAIVDAMNGRYEEAYEVFKDYASINRAVLLLCMRRNDEAWEALKNLKDDSAEAEYVRAIAANRRNDVNMAAYHMKRALAKKPELEDIMKVDGDVLDLKELIDMDVLNEKEDEQ